MIESFRVGLSTAISTTTRVVNADAVSNLVKTAIEMHRQMSSLFCSSVVTSRTAVEGILVKTSEILMENDRNFSIQYASTSGFVSKNHCAYL
jgi:hypothetical protein